MEKIPPTPSLQAAFIISRACLPAIFEPGAIVGKLPLPGRALTPEERGGLGLTKLGATMCYDVGGCQVLFDMSGDEATVWFGEGDFSIAGVQLEQSLRGVFTDDELSMRQVSETPAGVRTVEIVVTPKGRSRAALLSVSFGASQAVKGEARMFFCRIYPQQRVN
jgi:hypothetical protein